VSLDREQVESALPAYEIGGELGRGGWGVVLEGRHRRLGREVAIKQLPRAFGSDPGVRARFIAEARLLAALDHPHIVPVHDYVESDGLCLLVMEKLSGGTVWDRFQRDGLPMETSVAIALAACAGLHAAHQHGTLHRDVKPENLMFSASGVLKVTDFGIAKVVGGSKTMATRAGEVLGTPSYMAPEHAKGAELGPQADVYATAVTLYELLSGRLPFSDEGDAIAVLYRHVNEQPTPLGDVAPEVPQPIADVVMRAMAPSAEDRFESAEAFGVALADAAGAAWGPGWASERAGIGVMGSAPIVSALERTTPSTAAATVSASPVAAPSAMDAPTAAAAPPTMAAPARAATTVFPSAGGVTRHAIPEMPESPELEPLEEVAHAGGAPPGPGDTNGRRRGLLIGIPVAVVVIGVLAAVLLSSGGGKSNSGGAAPPASTGASGGVRTIFSDNFSNPASGWEGVDDANAKEGYDQGTFRMVIKTPKFRAQTDTQFSGSAFRSDLINLADVGVEADAEKLSTTNLAYGLTCRRGTSGEYYAGLVYSDGQATIEKVEPPGRSGGGVLGAAALPSATAPGRKHLRLECSGAAGGNVALRLFVNGAAAVAGNDPQGLAPSPVGMFAFSFDGVPTEVAFDNFAVKTLPPAPGH